MARSLPAIRTEVSPTLVGSASLPEVVEDWSYDALLVSEGHRRLRSGAWDGGGPFLAFHAFNRHVGKLDHEKWIGYGNNAGPFSILGVGQALVPFVDASRLVPTWASASEGLSPLYAKGYRRARPGNAEAGLGQFLVELRDLPRRPGRALYDVVRKGESLGGLIRSLFGRLGGYRALGNEYLNYQFGWKPFVKDLQDVYHLSMTIGEKIKKLRYESGSWLHRKVTVDKSVDTDYEEADVPYLYWGTRGFRGTDNLNSYGNRTYLSVNRVTRTKAWFEGSFRYFIDHPTSWLWDARARAALFGVLPTPELVWNVLPWSWLVDWFSNVDDILSNASPNAVDNLVMRYGYIMRTVTVTTTATAVCWHGGVNQPGWFEWKAVDGHKFESVLHTETKIRSGSGSPFSPDLSFSPESITPRRAAILASLGLTRARR